MMKAVIVASHASQQNALFATTPNSVAVTRTKKPSGKGNDKDTVVAITTAKAK